MVTIRKHKSVERQRYKDYRRVAVGFAEAADVAREFEYWNAAGVLIVHAAIAFADAITIREAGKKSQGSDHHDTGVLLESLCSPDCSNSKRAINSFHRIIEEKNLVSYSGEEYARKDIDIMWGQLVKFRDWATNRLNF